MHAVCSFLDTWYCSTHDRCAVFLIPYSPYCCVNHALFPLLFAPETKVAVLTRSSQTVVCDLQLDTFFGVPEHCLRNLQWSYTVWYAAVLPVLHYRSFGSLWLVKNLAELVDEPILYVRRHGQSIHVVMFCPPISCRSHCSRDCLTSVLRPENSTGQKSANDL